MDGRVGGWRWPWILLGIGLAVVMGTVLWAFLGTFVAALFIYYATRPLYRRLRRRIDSPSLAAGLAIVLLALPVFGIVGYTVVVAIGELEAFLDETDVDAIPPIADWISQYGDLTGAVSDPATLLTGGGMAIVGDALDIGLQYLGLVGSILLQAFIMFAVAFYLLRDGPRLSRWVSRYGDAGGVLDAFFGAVDRSLQRVFYGALLNVLLTAAIGAIVFSSLTVVAPEGLGIPYPALLGVLAGLASLIPVVGMKLVYVPLVAYLGVQAFQADAGLWFVGVVFVVALVIVDTIPDFVIRPYVSKGDLHVGLLMFAYIIGPNLFGWYGLFLGPILLVVVVHFASIVLPALIDRTRPTPGSRDPGQPDPAPARND